MQNENKVSKSQGRGAAVAHQQGKTKKVGVINSAVIKNLDIYATFSPIFREI